TAQETRGDIFDEFCQRVAIEHQMHGSAHARVAERFFLVVDPVGNDHTLIKVRARHAWSALNFPQADWVYSACIIDLASQERRPDFWCPGCEMIELEAIEVRQPLVPVVWISRLFGNSRNS